MCNGSAVMEMQKKLYYCKTSWYHAMKIKRYWVWYLKEPLAMAKVTAIVKAWDMILAVELTVSPEGDFKDLIKSVAGILSV